MTKKNPPKLNVIKTKVKVDPDLILQNLVQQFCDEHAKSCQHLEDYESPQLLFDQFYWLAMFHFQMVEENTLNAPFSNGSYASRYSSSIYEYRKI